MPAPAQPAGVELRPPRQFAPAAVCVVYAFGLLLAFPVALSVLAMTLVPASAWSLGLPLLGLGISAFLLPLGQGNLYIARLALRIAGRPPLKDEFIVQLTFQPRLHSGLRGFLETADDIGYLSFTSGGGVHFIGDAVRMHVAAGKARLIQPEGIGWRGLFLYPSPLAFTIDDGERQFCCQVAERSCWTVPCSHRVMRQMRERYHLSMEQGMDGP